MGGQDIFCYYKCAQEEGFAQNLFDTTQYYYTNLKLIMLFNKLI